MQVFSDSVNVAPDHSIELFVSGLGWAGFVASDRRERPLGVDSVSRAEPSNTRCVAQTGLRANGRSRPTADIHIAPSASARSGISEIDS